MQTRLPNHGGLTPPALVLVYGRLRAKKRFLRCANPHSQERRASARRGSVTHLQRRFVEANGRRNRRVAVSLLQTRLANHGWLTPAAPGARRSLAATCAICDLQTHMQPRAAGVRLPCVWETRSRRHKRTCSTDRRRCICGSPLHSRYIGTTGGLRPRSCLSVRQS